MKQLPLLLIHSLLEFGSSAEGRGLGGWDLDHVAGLRITAFTGSTLGYLEGSETYQLNAITRCQSLAYGIGNGLKNQTGSSQGEIGTLCDLVYKFGLVHLFSFANGAFCALPIIRLRIFLQPVKKTFVVGPPRNDGQ